jgi:DNA helicase-2/ATP-dependent DNA helicase PcrA
LPYIIYGSVRFYERAEIKVLLTYLRLLLNYRDDLAFSKCITTPKRGFGEKALETLMALSRQHDLSALQTAVRIVYGELPNPFARGLSGLRKFVELYTSLKIKLDAGESAVKVLESLLHGLNFEEHLRSNYPEDFDERWLNVIELQNALSEFLANHPATDNHPLADFLETAALMTEPTSRNVDEGSTEAVTLMTIHAAKGLEFEQVYVCGLEEGVLPHLNAMNTPAEVEEERRLLYVAMTRARAHLTMTSVRCQRFRRDLPTQASRFLDELPPDHVEIAADGPRNHRTGSTLGASTTSRSWSKGSGATNSLGGPNATKDWGGPNTQELLRQLRNKTTHNRGQPELGSPGDANSDTCPFEVGQKVRHKIFGDGVVQGIEPTLGAFRLDVRFAQVGVKKLLHNFVAAIEPEPSLDHGDDLPW